MMKSPYIKIGIGIVIALITGIIGLLFHGQKKQQDFREAWEIDEATEELQMFTPQEKIETLHHIKVAPTGADFKESEMIQQQILRELKEMRKIDTLNADQMFQIKKELRDIKAHR